MINDGFPALGRRGFLVSGGVLGSAGILAACSPAPTPSESDTVTTAAGGSSAASSTDSSSADAASAGSSSADSAGSSPVGSSSASSSPAATSTAKPITTLDAIAVGSAVSATANGARIIVSRPTSTTVAAFSAICTHQGCTVAPSGARLICPCHGSVFNALTGAVEQGPASRPLPSVAVTVDGGNVVAG